MPLFPAFLDLRGRPVLLVGGGKIAAHKLAKLLAFEPRLTIVAPAISAGVAEAAAAAGITVHARPFEATDLAGQDLVVVAVDKPELQAHVFELCRERHILCNCVDLPDCCDFTFGGLVMRGDLVLGISSSGKAPALAGALAKRLDELLPDGLAAVVEEVAAFRADRQPGARRMQEAGDLARALLADALADWPAPLEVAPAGA